MLTHGQGAVYAVFMESIAPVGAAEIGPIDAAYLLTKLLRQRPSASVHRMVVAELSDDLTLINNLLKIS